MIEDQEMRELFAAESAETLERMEQGLLALERTPEERELLEHVFRQAHSLKGSAASLGVSSVETVAHQFEDILDAARRGTQPLVAEEADKLYRALDVLRELVEEAVTGAVSKVDLRTFVEKLRKPAEPTAKGSAEESQSPRETPAPVPSPPADAPIAVTSPPPETPVEVGAGTLRVDTVRLDRALAEMGDLVVTTARIGLRQSEALEIQELYTQLARESGWKDHSDGSQTSLAARLEKLVRALADDHTRLKQITDHLQEEVREMRLLPLSGLLNRFPRMLRDMAQSENKKARLLLHGLDTTADRRILERLKSPLTHLLRNALDHGVELPSVRRESGKPEEATISISAERAGAVLEITIQDDGAGLDFEAIRKRALSQRLRTEEQLARAEPDDLSALLFVPGFSTRSVVSQLSGRGTGLDAVRAELESVNGTVSIESQPGEGTSFRLRMPLTIATSQVLICQFGQRLFALPLNFVERALDFDQTTTFPVEGRPCIEVEKEPVPVTDLASMVGCRSSFDGPCVVLRDQAHRVGFLTEKLVGVREVVVKPFHESSLVNGASILPDGRICLHLQPTELFRLARSAEPMRLKKAAAPKQKTNVLLVEDSPTLRALERRTLEEAGFQVMTAENGAQAWALVQGTQFAAVVSDIEMPEMNGLELTRKLRELPQYADVPIMLVTSLDSDESRMEGLEAGASAYLTKQRAQEGELVRLLRRLL